LARLRIAVFRAFPYLYEGTEDYEKAYLQTYVQSPRSVLVLALDGQRVVGASTAIPLEDETTEVQAPFIALGYDVKRVFYLGESVLEPSYRGQGIGVRFFEAREAHAQKLGGFDWSAFCAVVRPEDHPLRGNYTPLDAFWTHRGYTCHPELHTTFTWQDRDEATETAKPMRFWLKPLKAPAP